MGKKHPLKQRDKMSWKAGELILDPFGGVSRLTSKLYTLWVTRSYPFASIGKDVWVHYSCELPRSGARFISIGNHVTLQRDVWLNIAEYPNKDEPIIILEDGCTLNRRCVVSAIKHVQIGRNAIFGPSVFITDHNHAYDDPTIPIGQQGVKQVGGVRIEEGCWIGFGAAIMCNDRDELVIGRNSVIAANSLVTRSIPPYSVAMGNPARIIKQFDQSKKKWVLGSSTPART